MEYYSVGYYSIQPSHGGGVAAEDSEKFLRSWHEELNIINITPKHYLEGIRSHNPTKLLRRSSPETKCTREIVDQ